MGAKSSAVETPDHAAAIRNGFSDDRGAPCSLVSTFSGSTALVAPVTSQLPSLDARIVQSVLFFTTIAKIQRRLGIELTLGRCRTFGNQCQSAHDARVYDGQAPLTNAPTSNSPAGRMLSSGGEASRHGRRLAGTVSGSEPASTIQALTWRECRRS